MDANRSTVAANRLQSLKRLSLSASAGVDVSSAPQYGYRKYSLASSQFTLILGLRIRIK